MRRRTVDDVVRVEDDVEADVERVVHAGTHKQLNTTKYYLILHVRVTIRSIKEYLVPLHKTIELKNGTSKPYGMHCQASSCRQAVSSVDLGLRSFF